MDDNLDKFTNIVLIIIILVIIGLKIAGVITISWLWLLSPLWGLFLLGVIFAMIILISCLITNYIKDKKEKRNERY